MHLSIHLRVLHTMKCRVVACAVIAVSIIPGLVAQCPPGNITFNTQAQIDAFAADYPNCAMLTGEVLIVSQPAANITNLNGLSGLTSIAGSLRIQNCSGLTGFEGLSNLTTIGSYLYIGGCALPKNFNGLHNLASIGSYLQIANNRDLVDIAALSKLTRIPGDLRILSLQNLETLSGLHNLTSIGGDVEINNNIKLSNLTALNKVATIGGYLWVTNNRVLTTLNGLHMIAPGSITDLRLLSNEILSICDIDNICTYLAGPRSRMVSGNATGCASVAEILAACASVSVSDHGVTRVAVFPNPTTGLVYVEGIDRGEIMVIDALGRQVGQSVLDHGAADLSFLVSGVYNLLIRRDAGVSIARLVKE